MSQSAISASGTNPCSVVCRAEREAIAVATPGSQVVPYLNRLSSLLWTLARWVEADDTLLSRTDRQTTED